MRSPKFLAGVLLATLLFGGGVPTSDCVASETSAYVPAELSAWVSEEARPLWVFFGDKGRHEDGGALDEGRAQLSDRALARRAKVRPATDLVLWQDLPLEADYIAILEELGFEVRARSRWLNAVSVTANAEGLDLLCGLSFVARLDAVRPSVPRELRVGPVSPRSAEPAPGSPYDADGRYTGKRSGLDSDRDGAPLPIEYGGSLSELSQHNVPAVHDLGYTGAGVIIGMLDTGFNTNHEALEDVDVLGRWDFINDDPVVENEDGDAEGQQNHGTMTLSTIGGWEPGDLVGPAFGASFYLGKTEDTTDEQPIEEDYWVAGIEWLEAQGCDIVSSSLAYYGWYDQDDMDGDTAVTTIAADFAVSLGVLVVNSAGNYRHSDWGTIAAPADGDSVVACGAVEETGEIAGFSSPGPSADGRIKPDICARGVSNHVVVPASADEYQQASGTSFACPLTSGICALLLEAKPEAVPMQVLAALKATASLADDPDNDYGWGVIDALGALDYLLVTAVPDGALAFALQGNWPNPFNPATRIVFRLEGETAVQLDILNLQGRRVISLLDETLPAGSHEVVWDGRDAEGHAQSSGVYFARLSNGEQGARHKMVLLK